MTFPEPYEARYRDWSKHAMEFYIVARASYFANRHVPFRTCARESIRCLLTAHCHLKDWFIKEQDLGTDLKVLEARLKNLFHEPFDWSISDEWLREMQWERQPQGSHWLNAEMLVTLDMLFAKILSVQSLPKATKQTLTHPMLVKENKQFDAIRTVLEQ
jgi:hypothetical protein